jgi:hypothetical protein
MTRRAIGKPVCRGRSPRELARARFSLIDAQGAFGSKSRRHRYRLRLQTRHIVVYDFIDLQPGEQVDCAIVWACERKAFADRDWSSCSASCCTGGASRRANPP